MQMLKNMIGLTNSFLKIAGGAFMLMMSLVVFSCQQTSKLEVTPDQTTTGINVVDGMLIFHSKGVYFSTAKYLIGKSPSEQSAWSKTFGFTTYRDGVSESFIGPDFYTVLLNSKGKFQVADTVIKIHQNTVLSVPSGRKDLIQLLEKDIAAKELDPYRTEFKRPIQFTTQPSMGVESVTDAKEGGYGRQIDLDGKRWEQLDGSLEVYFPGYTNKFRYLNGVGEFVAGSWCTLTYSVLFEYRKQSNGGWYRASESPLMSANITSYSFLYPQFVSNQYTGDNPMSFNLTGYGDPGYTPHFSYDVSFSGYFAGVSSTKNYTFSH
jgi:hypothetical protein